MKVKRATIHEVARDAGVSKATVARVFSGEAPVAQRTRQQVMEAAKQLGYVPNLLARGLRGGRTHSVGIIWSLGRPSAEGAVREMAIRLSHHDYVTYMADCLSEPKLMEEALLSFAGRGVEAIILQADQRLYANPRLTAHFRKFRAVVMVVDHLPTLPTSPDADIVVRDPARAITELVDHWVAQGRRQLRFAGEEQSNQEKIGPFMERMAHHGLATDDVVIDTGPYLRTFNTVDQCLDAYDDYFADRPMCDAVLAKSDEGAAAMMLWLQNRGLRVPEDVAICGVSNTDLCRLVQPPLASLESHNDRSVDHAIQALLERLNGERTSKKRVDVSMTLIRRESIGGVSAEAPLTSSSISLKHDR